MAKRKTVTMPIGNLTFRVIEERRSENLDSESAQINHHKQTLSFHPELSDESLFLHFWHEVFHEVPYQCGVDFKSLDIEESTVLALSNMLVQFLRANPWAATPEGVADYLRGASNE